MEGHGGKQHFGRLSAGSAPSRRGRGGAAGEIAAGGGSVPLPGLPLSAQLHEGDEVVVKQLMGGGYNLKPGDTGRVMSIDGDGDVLIAFPDQDEQWVHSSMLPNFVKRSNETTVSAQVLALMADAVTAVCGWNIVVGVVDAMYWNAVHMRRPALTPVMMFTVSICVASFPLLDFCGALTLLVKHSGVLSVLPPLFFAMAGVHDVGIRSACLVIAATTLGWSTISTLSAPGDSPRRKVNGWGVLIAFLIMPMLRWAWDSDNLFLTSQWAQVTLGLCAAASALVVQRCTEAESSNDFGEDCSDSCFRVHCGCADWPAVVSIGLMGGATLVFFRFSLSSVQNPALSAYAHSGDILALETFGALTFGAFALAAVWAMTPWWLDTCQAALVIGFLPPVAGLLQCVAGPVAEQWGPVHGSGAAPHMGMLLLTAIFPFMLALLGKELALLAQIRAIGRTFFVAIVVAAAALVAVACTFLNRPAPIAAAAGLAGHVDLVVAAVGLVWCFGVWAAPGGASRPSVHDLWYLSRHSAPPQREYAAASGLGLVLLLLAFSLVFVPVRIAIVAPQEASGDDVLVVAGWNVRQGFDFHGRSNIDCVTAQLADSQADLVGLSDAYTPHALLAATDPDLAFASRLKMEYLRAAPSSLPIVGQSILTRLPMDKNSFGSVILSGPGGERARRGAAGVWLKSIVSWSGAPLHFHMLRLEELEDVAGQVALVARNIRNDFLDGALVLVVSVGRMSADPSKTELAQLVNGTGLSEAWGALGPGAKMSLPPTEFVTGQHLDFIFYRGLSLVGNLLFSDVQCTDHILGVASFRSAPH